ncbi:MAG: recombinase family protein [Verrucomicrobiota bacterium]
MQAVQRTSQPATRCTVPVAIYTRVSTLGQVGGRFDSCESQAAICREHVLKQAAEGWYEAACYSDPAYSGGTLKRPGMEALLRHIEAGGIKIVLIFKLERVLRSTDEWVPLRAFLKKHGCRLVSPTENLSDETAMERFHNNLRVNLAEFERGNTSEKVKAKMLAQAKEGIWNCGQVPYGYDYDVKAKTLHPNPTESAVVRRIYELTARLASLTDIANTLNDEGLRTRPRVFKRRYGRVENVGAKRFRSDLLRKMVRSAIYVGRVRLNGAEFQARHTPLVSEDLWERANAAIAKPLEPAPDRFQSRDKLNHLLKGIAFCGCCGRALIPNHCGKASPDGKPYRYYTCGQTHKERASSTCPLRHLPAATLEAVVVSFLGEVARQPAIIQSASESSRLRGKTDRVSLRAQVTKTDESLAKVNRQLRNCADAIALGGADALGEELRERAVAFKQEKQGLLLERERLRQELSACEQDELDAQRIRQSLERFGEVLPGLSPAEQKDLVALCIDRIEVRVRPDPKRAKSNDPVIPGRHLELRLKLPVANLVAGMEEKLVIEQRSPRAAIYGKRLLLLEASAVLGQGGQSGHAVITAPFHREVGQPVRPRPASPGLKSAKHPIHRALAWQRQLDTHPRLNRVALARKNGVVPAVVTKHLQLLALAPAIQSVLLQLKSPREIRYFSLAKLRILAALGQTDQLRRFADLRAALAE